MTFWLLNIWAALCLLLVGIGSPLGVYESQITFTRKKAIVINIFGEPVELVYLFDKGLETFQA